MQTTRFAKVRVLLLWAISAFGPNAFPAAPAMDGPAVLITNVASLRALPSEQAGRAYPVELQAVVTYYDAQWDATFVQDATGGIYMPLKGRTNVYVPGQILRIEGSSDPGEFAPILIARQLEVVGQTNLPPAKPVTLTGLLTGSDDSLRVEIKGLVQSAVKGDGNATLQVVTETGSFPARVMGLGYEFNPAAWVDAVVRLRGSVGAIYNRQRQLVGVRLLVPSPGDITVEEPPMKNRYGLPIQPISKLLRFSPQGALRHRTRVVGAVIYQRLGHMLFIQNDQAVLMVLTSQDARVVPGDWLDVVGFPAVEEGRVALVQGEFEVLSRRPPPAAQPASGRRLLGGTLDGQLVQAEGKVLGDWMKTDNEWLSVLEVDGAVITAQWDPGHGAQAMPALEPGGRVRLTGICWNKANEVTQSRGVQLLVRGPEDLVVLKRPSWWNVRRALALMAILGVCAAGALVWVIVLRCQIQQREQAERRLLESEALYQSLVQNLPASVLRKDRDGRVVFGNQHYVQTMGRPLSEMLGKTDFDLCPKELATKYWQDDERVMRTGEIFQGVERHPRPNGEELFVEVWKTPVRTAEGAVVGVQVLFWDVSERERAKEALNFERDLLDTLLQNIPDRVYFKDRQSRFVKFSKKVAIGLGVTDPAMIVNKTDNDFFTEEHARAAFEDEQRIMRTGEPVIGLVEKETWQGGLVSWVLSTKMPWRNKAGEIIGTFGVSKDITALKQAEAELAHERGLFRTLLDTIPDYIYFKDKQSRFVQVSRSLARYYALSDPAACKGKTDFDFYGEERARPAFEDEQQILRTGQPLLGKLEGETQPDGRQTWILTTKMPWHNAEGEIIGTFGISKDITALKKAEAELDYERELFRTLLDTMPDAIYFKDRQSRCVRVSRAFAEHVNVADSAQAEGKTDFDFFTEEHARPAFEDELKIIRTGEPIIGKLERETYADGRVTWALTTKIPWRDKSGAIIGTMGVSRDISDLKRAEERLEQTHRQLLQISRQAGMAEVATGVLHNVGNVLNSVNVSSNLICDRLRQSPVPNLGKVVQLLNQQSDNLGQFLTQDPRGQQVPSFLQQLSDFLTDEQTVLLNEIQSLMKNVQHINEIVAMQQNYARVVGVVEQVSLDELTEDALRLNAGAYFRHQVQVVREFAQLPPIKVERHRVLQILVNLLSNAKYACDEAGRDDKRITVRTRLRAEDHALIEVSDNGIGIAPENLTRIFSHGFTTRKKGHGFGLHTSALAAKAMGGALSVASAGLGQGATFTIELPLQPPPNHSAYTTTFDLHSPGQ